MFQTGIIYRSNCSMTDIWLPSFLAILLVMTWIPAEAQVNPRGAIEIEEGGQLWIEGSAKIVDYICRARQLSGNGNIQNITEPQKNVEGEGDVSIRISIPVESLDCGKRKMNRDLYEALKSEEYPAIHYQLLKAQLADSADQDQAEGGMNIEALGVLRIAGQADTTQITVHGQLLQDNRFRVKGRKHINMKTFDIEPPSAMFGLIKASRELTVNFDVTVRLSRSEASNQQKEKN